MESAHAGSAVMGRAVRRLVRRLQSLVPSVRSGATILAYHLVDAGTDSPVDLPADLFEAQLDSLAGRVRSLDEALRALAALAEETSVALPGDAGRPAAEQLATVVLTFDDAYANFYHQVFPRLVAWRLPAVLYVATGFVDGQEKAPIRGTEGLGACTWEQLREMAASGLVTLGSHTVTHPSLTHIEPERAAWELAASRARIEEMTGQPVRHFCYPRALWSRKLEPLVRREYATATIGGGGSITYPYDPLRLQRTSLRREFGADVLPIVRNRVWLEERLADVVRRVRN